MLQKYLKIERFKGLKCQKLLTKGIKVESWKHEVGSFRNQY